MALKKLWLPPVKNIIQVPGLETFLRALPTKHFTALSYSFAQAEVSRHLMLSFLVDLFLMALSYIDGFPGQGYVEALWSRV